MNPLTLFINAIRGLLGIPPLLIRFILNVLRGNPDAVNILQDELPNLIFRMSPLMYVSAMIIALVTLMSSGGIKTVALQFIISIICSIWMFVTILLGVQEHDTRLIQAQSIQYYLLLVGFMQTFAWVVHPENPSNEPSSVFILFMATSVTFINEKVIRPNIEKTEVTQNA